MSANDGAPLATGGMVPGVCGSVGDLLARLPYGGDAVPFSLLIRG